MRWWLRSRRLGVAGFSVVGFVILVVGWGGRIVPAPGFFGQFVSPVPFSVYLPLAAVIGVILSLSSSPPDLESSAARRVSLLDVTLVSALLSLAAIGCGAAWFSWAAAAPVEGVRNLAGYLGLALIGLSIAGPVAGTLTAVVYAVIASTFGFRPSAQTVHWSAWPLASAQDSSSLFIAIALFMLGSLVFVLRGRPASWQRGG